MSGIKKYQPILARAKERADNERNTSDIVKEIITNILGYDRHEEVTGEYAVKHDRCDLAIKLDSVLKVLIEVKGIMVGLKDRHVEQAVLYTARKEEVRWAILSNGMIWQVYRVTLGKKIDAEQLFSFDFMELKPKSEDLELLYLLCKEAWSKGELDKYYEQKQALDKHLIGAIIQTEPVLRLIRKILRRITPDAHIACDHVQAVLLDEVIIGEVMNDDSGKAKHAKKVVEKALRGMVHKSDEGKVAASVTPLPPTS